MTAQRMFTLKQGFSNGYQNGYAARNDNITVKIDVKIEMVEP